MATKTEFVKFAPSCYANAPSVKTFGQAIVYCDFAGKWIRMYADSQRGLLGFNVFGKQEIYVSESGFVRVARSTGFGADSEVASYSPAQIAYAVANRLKISPGVSGPGMFTGILEKVAEPVKTVADVKPLVIHTHELVPFMELKIEVDTTGEITALDTTEFKSYIQGIMKRHLHNHGDEFAGKDISHTVKSGLCEDGMMFAVLTTINEVSK